MKQQPPSWNRTQYTAEEKQLAAELAKPDVNEEFANDHIRQQCEQIQTKWSETEERSRRVIRQSEHVEVTVGFEGSQFRRAGARRSD